MSASTTEITHEAAAQKTDSKLDTSNSAIIQQIGQLLKTLRNKSGGMNGQNLKTKCDHCHRNGYTKDGCWFLHPHLRPTRGNEKTGGLTQKAMG